LTDRLLTMHQRLSGFNPSKLNTLHHDFIIGLIKICVDVWRGKQGCAGERTVTGGSKGYFVICPTLARLGQITPFEGMAPLRTTSLNGL
jgi:hypothetical protein